MSLCLFGFWMLCTFNHIVVPQHYVYSLYVACLGEQVPSPWILITSSKFSDDLSSDWDELYICVYLYTHIYVYKII